MFKMKPESEAFLRKHFSEQDVERMLNSDNVRDILGPLDEFMYDEGYFPFHEKLNDLGRETERVYDDIYYSNVNTEDE